jgi:hypothetical protein
MRSRLPRDAAVMEERVDVRTERAPRERLAHVIGLPVIDSAGLTLGVVVGRIISGTTIDLLVRRRRLFHRSRYLRLQGAAITVSGRTLVYHPLGAPNTLRLEVVQTSGSGERPKGDAA